MPPPAPSPAWPAPAVVRAGVPLAERVTMAVAPSFSPPRGASSHQPPSFPSHGDGSWPGCHLPQPELTSGWGAPQPRSPDVAACSPRCPGIALLAPLHPSRSLPLLSLPTACRIYIAFMALIAAIFLLPHPPYNNHGAVTLLPASTPFPRPTGCAGTLGVPMHPTRRVLPPPGSRPATTWLCPGG